MTMLNNPALQIVHLTRGSVVLAGEAAYACTNSRDILLTVAALLPVDGTLATPEANGTVPQPPPVAPESPVPGPEAPPDVERNPLYQKDNLLRLCEAWSTGRISDEQFDDYLAETCPDIGIEEAYLTRDSFTGGADVSEMLETASDPA